ncbi:MAG: glycoside hydrolase family 10 protein [Vicinamibacterales bacterium]
MSFDGGCARAAAALAIAIGVYAFPGSSGRTFAASDSVTTETRALWVQRGSLATPHSIATVVKSARDHGFNTLLVQVRGRGDAYYLGGVEPRAAELLHQPDDFDPLATVLDAGHAAGLRIHAWINLNLISSAAALPSAREHLIYRHPAWLMVPRDIGLRLASLEPDSPGYVGTLARWTRTQSAEIEGLYLSPIVPEAADYTDSIVGNLVRRYPVDGIHFDYARYPNDRFDYSRSAIREFRTSLRGQLSDSARRTLDAQEQDDLFAYPDSLPDEWREFRSSRMTALMKRLHATVKRERPDALVSVAVVPDVREAERSRLQRWGAWAQAGLVDAVCPMAYATDPSHFAEQIEGARAAAASRPLWAGIGSYRLSPKETIDNILTARRLGANGIVLFSYDSLISPRQPTSDYLAVVGQGAFAPPASATAGSR